MQPNVLTEADFVAFFKRVSDLMVISVTRQNRP